MKIKRCIAAVVAAALSSTLIAGTASAHTGDILNGKYIGQTNGVSLLLRLDSSAVTSFLSYDRVYQHAADWNGRSDNVNVSIINYTPGMPTVAGQMLVCGKEYYDDTLGQTVPYDSNGKQVYGNDDWKYVTIYMNSDPNAFSASYDPPTAAKKTFIHEVGHALKLAHPIKNSYLNGHTESDGRPFAVMNQRFPYPDNVSVSHYITLHDRDNLIAKWG